MLWSGLRDEKWNIMLASIVVLVLTLVFGCAKFRDHILKVILHTIWDWRSKKKNLSFSGKHHNKSVN